MNDRELLEAAAKAAGIEWLGWSPKKTDDASLSLAPLGRLWNPLVSDSDALRLAVSLRMNVFHAGVCVHAVDEDGNIEASEGHEQDHCAATRRAIVRAAAAMATP